MPRRRHWRSWLDPRDPDFEPPPPPPDPDDQDPPEPWAGFEDYDGPPSYEGSGGECKQWKS